MIRLKIFHLNVHIHILTVIYFILCWITQNIIWYLSALLIVCIHELCHLLMAYYFHFDIEKVEILPFGAYLSLRDFYFHPISHEICVVLAGPCSHLGMYYFINLFIKSPYHELLLMLNTFVFFFNLLPIYPMDGHRFICLCLQSVMDLQKSFYLSLKMSVLSLVILGVCYCQINTIIIIVYLLCQQFSYFNFIPSYLRIYFSQIPFMEEKKKMIIHHHYYYHRGCHNYYLIQSQLYDEKSVINELLKTVKK